MLKKIKETKKEKLIILALAATLIVAVVYILTENFARTRQAEINNAYLLGVNDGRIQLLNNILTQIQSSGVARLTITAGDQTATIMLAPVMQAVQANTSVVQQ